MPKLRLDWDLIRKRLGIVVEKPVMEKFPQVVKPKPLEPDPPLAASSTGTIAGSMERIEVYRRRAANGQSVFHPNDNREIRVRQSHSHVG